VDLHVRPLADAPCPVVAACYGDPSSDLHVSDRNLLNLEVAYLDEAFHEEAEPSHHAAAFHHEAALACRVACADEDLSCP